MINVTLIGFGNVGSSLALLLLANQQALRLNIIEPDEQAEGAFLDLAHSLPLYPQKELHINNEELFCAADFIFFTAGTPNVTGSSRLSTAQQNSQLAREIFENRTLKPTAYIIIITNPVDIITHAVYQFSGLPSNQVLGTGTFLDSVRLGHYLSSVSNYAATDFKVLVLGEHGSSQVPIYSNTTLNGKAILNRSEFSAEDLHNAAELTKNAATEIRKTQTGTHYGVAKCAEVLFDYLLSKEKRLLPLSILTNEHYRNLLQLEHDICISLPVTLKNGKAEIYTDIQLSEKELEALRKSAATVTRAME
ncbi:MAG: L-lactate dehydrogenase [Vicingaceae bacterium]|jgi:L-lactate dehydrogenase